MIKSGIDISVYATTKNNIISRLKVERLMDIYEAESLGVGFIIDIEVPHGGAFSYYIEPHQILNLKNDPEGTRASILGLTKGEYFRWLKSDGHLTCSGRNRSGSLCKNVISGTLSAEEWKSRQGECCHYHQTKN